MILKEVVAKKILNSRKEPTISVMITTGEGKFEVSAPGGKSRGKHEAAPYSKNGIDFSINFLNAFGKKLIQSNLFFKDMPDLEKVEEMLRVLDKTDDFSIIGANVVFVLEAVLLKAMAASYKKPLWNFLNNNPKILPKPLGNCIGGGKHVNQNKKTDFQEFLFLPKTKNFVDAYLMNLQAYKEAKKLLFLKDKEWNGQLTDENAMAATLDNESVIHLLKQVTENIKKEMKIDMGIGIDAASSSFFNGIVYHYKNLPGAERMQQSKQIEYIARLIEQNNLIYVEDPLNEEDFEGFARLLRIVEKKNPNCLIVGDDLICTNYERLRKAINMHSINAVIIKPNQIGSILETKRVVDLAHKHGIVTIISHRSGETLDNTIAHLAVAWQIPIIKTGILGRERLAKLNEILKIERGLSETRY